MNALALGHFKSQVMQNRITVNARSAAENYKTIISNGINTIIADEPEQDGGRGAGPTPDELLVMALSACTNMTIRMYCERKGWDVGEIYVEVTMVRNENGTQGFERVLHFEKPPEALVLDRILLVANKCPVHKILVQASVIQTTIQ